MQRKSLVSICAVLVILLLSTLLTAASPAGSSAQAGSSAVAEAKVNKLSGDQNELVITISVDGEVVVEGRRMIGNNSAGEYIIGDYKVFVRTSGNDKVDACYISQIKKPAFQVINPRESRAPIDAVGISERLDTLDGKTIAIWANYDPTMAPTAVALQEALPNTKIIWMAGGSSSANQVPVQQEAPIINMAQRDFDADPTIADAILVGNGF
ncbi:MAG: hypothetical protein FWH49_04815 [Clostridiales bacterium]|nr:hypothetical protein [Clostridiales bacterium]